MSSSTAARRRRRPSPVRKLRPFWFLVAVLALLCCVGTYLLLTWPALYPRAIDVVGNRTVAPADIIQRAEVNPSQNMWLQNTGAMRSRIEAIPYVDTAAVYRRPPDTMIISVTERAPYAVVSGEGGEATIDDTLRVLQTGAALESLPRLELPKLVLPSPGKWILGNDVDTLARVAAHAAAAHLSADALSYDRFGDVVLKLRSGVLVLLGDGSDLDRKLAMVEPILTQVEHGSKRIAGIDLRAITTPVVQYAK